MVSNVPDSFILQARKRSVIKGAGLISTVQIQINWFIQFSPWKRSTKLRHSKGNKSLYCYGYQLKSAKNAVQRSPHISSCLGWDMDAKTGDGPILATTNTWHQSLTRQPWTRAQVPHNPPEGMLWIITCVVRHRRNSVEKYKNRRVTNQETRA